MNIASATIISFTGDTAAQYIEHNGLFNVKSSLTNPEAPFSPNLSRTSEMNSWAIVGLTPLNMLQQGFIAERLWPAFTHPNILKKVLLCVVCTPLNNSAFFTFRSHFIPYRDYYLHNGPKPTQPTIVKHLRAEIDHKLADTVLLSWAWWTPVNLLNFALVPAAGRHLWTSFFAVCWMSYLSYKANEAILEEEGDGVESKKS